MVSAELNAAERPEFSGDERSRSMKPYSFRVELRGHFGGADNSGVVTIQGTY
jgi:hypothetical protein